MGFSSTRYACPAGHETGIAGFVFVLLSLYLVSFQIELEIERLKQLKDSSVRQHRANELGHDEAKRRSLAGIQRTVRLDLETPILLALPRNGINEWA
jgi:hypothetical protein